MHPRNSSALREGILVYSPFERTLSSYSEAAVIICAPQAYRKAHPETETFDAFISYEEIAAFLKEQKPTSARKEYREAFLFHRPKPYCWLVTS
jgi:hypothetical protein